MPNVVIVSRRAEKYLEKLRNVQLQERLLKQIRSLRENSFPPSCKHLLGKNYRLRVGSYRIVYQISDTHIIIIDIDHRKDVYR